MISVRAWHRKLCEILPAHIGSFKSRRTRNRSSSQRPSMCYRQMYPALPPEQPVLCCGRNARSRRCPRAWSRRSESVCPRITNGRRNCELAHLLHESSRTPGSAAKTRACAGLPQSPTPLPPPRSPAAAILLPPRAWRRSSSSCPRRRSRARTLPNATRQAAMLPRGWDQVAQGAQPDARVLLNQHVVAPRKDHPVSRQLRQSPRRAPGRRIRAPTSAPGRRRAIAPSAPCSWFGVW